MCQLIECVLWISPIVTKAVSVMTEQIALSSLTNPASVRGGKAWTSDMIPNKKGSKSCTAQSLDARGVAEPRGESQGARG